MSGSDWALKVEGLDFAYHGQGGEADRQVLHQVSFQIAQGEKVGMVGPNGAGKSTLLLHLNGLLTGQGRLEVKGRSICKEHMAWVRSQVGMVFADPDDQLFMPTLVDDVAFGPLNMGEDREQARQSAVLALQRMGLKGFEDRSPHHLSDGERRRAALATVLSMNPSIWVLDEPAANLDPRARRELIALLKSLDTVFVASHDLDLVLQVCDRCLVLDAGRIVADGPVREVLGQAELMEKHGLEVPLRLKLEEGSLS